MAESQGESNQSPNQDQSLVIPEGINYECAGCGKCCSGWSVPLTKADYERISAIDWAEKNEKFQGLDLFRELKDYEKKGSPYTHAIKHGDDGYCPFVVNKLCFIHSSYESKTKPSICQLFPYNFNETPSGFISTVSFVSVGAVTNHGKALSEQKEYLQSKLADFRALYPDHHPNWEKVELVKEVPLKWDEYLAIEKKMLDILNERQEPINMRMARMSLVIVEEYLKRRGSTVPEAQRQITLGESKHALKKSDHVLLRHFQKLYFPEQLVNRSSMNFSASKHGMDSFLSKIGFAPPLNFVRYGERHSLSEVLAVGFDDRQGTVLEDILYRYLYQRIFGKLYFAAGYGQLSVMVGFHHLIAAVCLLKLEARMSALLRKQAAVSEDDLITTVRMLEKRLGDSSLDGYAAAVLELELQSHGRILRFLSIGQ